MAKYKPTSNVKKEVKTYPSACGSHASMVVEDELYDVIKENSKYTVCEDARGKYLTEVRILDNGLMDSYRTMEKEARDKLLAKELAYHQEKNI